jgi:hypothetical protein
MKIKNPEVPPEVIILVRANDYLNATVTPENMEATSAAICIIVKAAVKVCDED